MECQGSLNFSFISLFVEVVHMEWYGILMAVQVATLATWKSWTLSLQGYTPYMAISHLPQPAVMCGSMVI